MTAASRAGGARRGPAPHLDDMGNVVVTQKNGTPVLVKDLGSVTSATWSAAAFWARTTTRHVEGIVLLLKDENPSRVMARSMRPWRT
jgi:cobalt-zinc-cadmium resistance protein CzcA